VRYADEHEIRREEVSGFDSPVGKGVMGTVAGTPVLVGNAAFLAGHGADAASLAGDADQARTDGATVVFVAIGGKVAGFIAVADPIKATARAALDELRAGGVDVIMLTGDNTRTAAAIAAKLGLTDFKADVLPQDKAAFVADLKSNGRVVAMAGDGVNDAPALAAADVGIAMGTGADIAMESASMTLLQGDLMGLVRARNLSRATMRNIRQNLFFAFAYNAAGIPIAAGVFYPVLGWLLTPAVGAAAMALSSVSVIANALRLRRQKV